MKNIFLVTMALIALAANSVLCRLALGHDNIDPVSFTVIRLGSGAFILFLIFAWHHRKAQLKIALPLSQDHIIERGRRPSAISRLSNRLQQTLNGLFARGSLSAAVMLFLYAICFSIAYLDLDTGTGALILFGAVQLTMIIVSLLQGQRLSRMEWAGVITAFAGFVYLVLPGLSTPSLMGFVLMTLAGVAWGGYTLLGRGSTDPVADTASNFLRTWPMLLLLLIWLMVQGASLTLDGVYLALISGAITSGLGYVIWYQVLRLFSATQAAVLQLMVPVIAAFGGVLFVAEAITLNLVVASATILGGIALVIKGRKRV